jgi:hypothetical protein
LQDNISHEAFPQLPDATVLWRYTDLPKLLWVLTKKALYLSRGDLLGDAFEGSVPMRYFSEIVTRRIHARIEARKANPMPANEQEDGRWMADQVGALRAHHLAHRHSAYLSCWRQGCESEAMWRLYCGPHEGIAMVTTFDKLKASLTDPAARLGAVRYLDYSRDTLPSDNAYEPIMHKRIAFEHEQEVRVVLIMPPEAAGHLGPPGLEMPWNVETVLDRIVVSSYAPKWYLDVVREVLAKFAPVLVKRLSWSDLRADPVF